MKVGTRKEAWGESGTKEATQCSQRDPKRRPGSAVTPQGDRRTAGKVG